MTDPVRPDLPGAPTARASVPAGAGPASPLGDALRTPLHGILRLTQQLLQGDLSPAARGQAEGIRHSVQSLVTLLDDAREGASPAVAETLDFDLRVALEPVTAAVQAMARDRGLVWTNHVDVRVPSRVQGDPGRLRQVLLLLGSHAVQTAALGEAGLRLERESEDDVQVSLRFVIGHVAVPGAVTESLTVTVVRHMVEAMGGTLTLSRHEHDRCDATVCLTLPKQTERPLPALPEDFTLAGTRVLVADGHAGDRAALGVMLSGSGCDVALADNGPVALRLVHEAAARGTPFRVVVLDRDLAMLDGEELGRAIRSDRELDATELVMVTTSGRVGDGARVRAAGFAAYLVKPFPATQLMEAITEVLHPSRAERPHGHAPLITRHSLAEARRSRLRILLVDDDPVNQLVTTSALHRVGYSVEVAPTAARAVARAGQQHWDLVLMNLPVSEAESTRIAAALRTHAGDAGRTPLVGLTADRTTVVDGLDAVLRKPVRFEELGEVVERFTTPLEPFTALPVHGAAAGAITLVSARAEADDASGPRVDEAPPAPGDGPAIDLEQLENACMGIPALRASLMQTFLSDVQPRLERLADAFAQSEPERVEFEAHGLKGMCATLGANDCARLFAVLEDRARDRWHGDPQPWLDACRAEVARAEAFIRRFERIVAQPEADAA